MNSLPTAERWLEHWLEQLSHTRKWQAKIEGALAPHGMTLNELLVLKTLHSVPAPGITQVELVRRLALSPALMCGLMETLLARNWIQSTRSQQDRRRVLCCLSSQGELQLTSVLQSLVGSIEMLPGTMPREVAA
jgi:DNA-binding MarR family transcriptional regulator